MPDNDDRDSQEQRRRWERLRTNTVALFSKAKSIFLKQPKINSVGQNANFTRQNFTASGDQYIFFAEPNATYVERPDARGGTNNWCSYRLLISVTLLSESDQHGHRPIPATQDSHGSRDQASQTALVQELPSL